MVIRYCAVICLWLMLVVSAEKQLDMTVHIEPGDRACFYEYVKPGQVIDIEYQVIDGGHGDLDVSFELQNPNGYHLVREYKKSDNIHRVTATTDGDHEFCFDNSFSTFSRKTVFFEIIIETDGEGTVDEWGKELVDGLTPDELVDVKVSCIRFVMATCKCSNELFFFRFPQLQDIQDILFHMHGNLNKVKHDLDIRRSMEARDRNLAEENNFRVTTWSFVQICLMIVVGGIQVYMLRSLFETDPRANVWKKYNILK